MTEESIEVPIMTIPKKGKFVVLEGMDGSGKTTAAIYLSNKLRELGATVIQTREIGGTPMGEGIRNLLFQKNESGEVVNKSTRLLMALAARVQHIHNVIYPATARGDIVVCDRYSDSTHVYQSIIDELKTTVEAIERLPDISFLSARPDYLIFLDISAEVSMQRAKTRITPDNDTYKNNLDKAKIICTAYRERIQLMSSVHPQPVFKIDAEQTFQSIYLKLDSIAKVIFESNQ